MAIIVCRECREETDNRRDRCVHCGAPLAGGDIIVKEKRPFNLFLLIVVSIVVLIAAGAFMFFKSYFVAPADYDLVQITSREHFLSAIKQRKYSIVIIYNDKATQSYDYLPIAKEIGKKYNLNMYKFDSNSSFYPGEGEDSNLFGRAVNSVPVTLIYQKDILIASHEGFQGRDFIEKFLEENKVIKNGLFGLF